MLTCGLSCLNALNALFAKLVAVVIVNRARKEVEGGGRIKSDKLHPRTDKDSSTATARAVRGKSCIARPNWINYVSQSQRFLSAFHLYTRGL